MSVLHTFNETFCWQSMDVGAVAQTIQSHQHMWQLVRSLAEQKLQRASQSFVSE